MVDAYVSEPIGEADRERLILEHISLVRHIAGRLTLDLPGSMDRDDLIGFGMIGLIGAADSWDSGRGLKFSTFAYPRIRGSILDELRRSDFLPRGRREKVRNLDTVVARLEQDNGVPPSPELLAEAMQIDLDEIDEIIASAAGAVEATLDEGPGDSLAALLRDPTSPDPVESAEWNEMKNLLVRVIEDLPDQEKTVITLYYAEELLLREIASIMEVTESRISQIHSRALFRLNGEMVQRGADSIGESTQGGE